MLITIGTERVKPHVYLFPVVHLIMIRLAVISKILYEAQASGLKTLT